MVHFDYFSSQAWFFCIISGRFQKHPSKTEVCKCLWNIVYRLETLKFGCLLFTKQQFLEKLSPLVHLGYSSLKTWIFGITHQNIQKIFIGKWSLQISICDLLQAKHLVITPGKDERAKVVLSYRLQQNEVSSYDQIVEKFPLQLSNDGAASWFDLLLFWHL